MLNYIELPKPIGVPAFMNVRGICEHFDLSHTTVYRWLAADLIEGVKPSRPHSICVASVYQHLGKKRRRHHVTTGNGAEIKLLDAVIEAQALHAKAPPDQIDEAFIALNRAKHVALRHFGMRNYAHQLQERKRGQIEERRRERDLPR